MTTDPSDRHRSTRPRIPAEWTSLDDSFSIKSDKHVLALYSDGRWLEGPAHSVQGRYLLFSDIPSEQVLRYDELTGETTVYSATSRFANGRTFDAQGRLVTCLHGARSVERLEHDGTTTIVADRIGEARLNSPNDVAVHPDGSVWFTDPTYGIDASYEGHAARQEAPTRGVYRWAEGEGAARLVYGSCDQPNGIAISRDGSTVFVTDSGRQELIAFPSDDPERVDVLVAEPRGFDGIVLDRDGRIWAGTADGVSCFTTQGREVGRLALPEAASNLAFGGARKNVLYATATTTLYSIHTSVIGAV